MEQDIVTGMPAAVGYTTGGRSSRRRGISDKDMLFFSSEQHGVQTREILAGQRFEAEHLRDAIHANEVAIEKGSAATALAICDSKHELARQLAECCCEIRKEVADVKATVLENDARRVRDDLAQCRTELLLMRSGGNGNGNSARG